MGYSVLARLVAQGSLGFHQVPSRITDLVPWKMNLIEPATSSPTE
jgi:hypothetical protein